MLRALLFKYICTAYKSDDDPKEAKRFWGSWDTAQGGVMSINQVKTQTEAVVEVSRYLGNINVSASLLQLHYLAYRIWELNRLSHFSDSQRNIHYFKYMFKYLVLLSLYYIFWEKKKKNTKTCGVWGNPWCKSAAHLLPCFVCLFLDSQTPFFGNSNAGYSHHMLCGFPLSAPQRNWQPCQKGNKTVYFTHKKKGFEGLIQDQNF